MSVTSELERIMAGKSALASAIEEKGVPVPDGTRIDDMSALVRSIPNGGSGGGGDGAQADWNAAEGEAGHVLNRTHYMVRGAKTVYPEMVDAPVEDTTAYFTGKWEYYPSLGEICIVNYNGATYECPVLSFDSFGINMNCAGNPMIAGTGEDNGQPFCIALLDETSAAQMGSYGFCMVADGSATVTVSVSCNAYHKLSKLFLPDVDWMAEEGKEGHILNRTHYSEFKWILEETTLEEMEGVAFTKSMPEVGKTYTVRWNGVPYECTAIDYAGVGVNLGNIGGAGGFPFSLLFFDYDSFAWVSITVQDGSTPCTVSVDEGEIVHKLDEKFIPDMSELILKSPNGTRYRITVNDSGTLAAAAVS